MTKLSYDAAWADMLAMARSNASVLAILAGVFLLLPNFAQLLFVPPPVVRTLDWNGIRQMQDYYSANAIALLVCNLPVWLGSAAILALLLDPRRLTVAEALGSGLQLLLAVILLNWITQFIVVTGLLLLIVPGVYLIGRLILAAPVQMAERIGNPFRVIRRSFALSAGNGWRVAGLVLLVAVVAMVVAATANAIIGIVLSIIAPKPILAIALALLRSTAGAITSLVLLLVGAALYRQLATAA